MHKWKPFPYDNADFLYPGSALEDAWEDLHGGDKEPFPIEKTLQEAWRCFHRGDFQKAVELADKHGLAGHAAANKASGIYATYLEPDPKRQVNCFQAAIARAEKAINQFPEDANAYYFHAFNLGRYSQSISVVKALKQGVAGKIMNSLKQALKLQPQHAEAHTAMAMYHAEIIDKVGKMLGGVTYGASEARALEHFQRALEITPRAPIALIEYGNGLYLLYGDRQFDEVSDLYVRASELVAHDAMEKLDIESALAELE